MTRPDLHGNAETVSRSGFTLEWTTDQTGDAILIVSLILSNDGSTVLDYVVCVANDDGGFQINDTLWTNWLTNQWVAIYVGRVNEGKGTFPFNNAQTSVAAIYWNLGLAISQ